MTDHVFNLRSDNRYSPDRHARMLRAPTGVSLPPKAATSQWKGKTKNQLTKGACTGEMGAEVRELLYCKLWLFEKDKSVLPDDFIASPDFVYLENLKADGDLGNDAGSTIHQTFVTLNQKGVCLESQDPYDVSNVSTPPTSEQEAAALVYKGGSYHNLPDLITMKSCIASGYSCGGGIDVYDSFESSDLSTTGFMPMPGPDESLLGGHAQHFMDYDDTMQFPDGSQGGFFVQNSWGDQWGISAPNRTDRGCYWMPYVYVQQGHVNDVWMIHLGGPWG